VDPLAPALERLTQSVPKAIDLSLDRIRAGLTLLGSPEKRLPPVIHLAGTNGKGSTLAFLRSIYRAAGYRVHSYSSPHIVSFCERIHLNNQDVTPQVLADAIDDFLRVTFYDATFFEALTIIAFHLFAAHPADVLILETGLGGRGDATNVVDDKCATLLTPISMDHQDRLGDTLEKIAREKIAIFRPNTPIFCGLQHPNVTPLVRDAASALNAPLTQYDIDFIAESTEQAMLWRDLRTGEALRLPAPSLHGAHQIQNAALATACVLGLQGVFPVSQAALARGLRETFWPARLQSVNPASLDLPPAWSVIVDGSHNAAGAQTLRAFLDTQSWQRRILVMGCLARKDWRTIVGALASWPTEIHLVPVTGHDTSWDLREVKAHLAPQTIPITLHETWSAALASLPTPTPHPASTGVIITGSLYLAGDVLGGVGGE
jgi:dihydrofolate synthase/folylpolyglutamate synthase